MWDYLSKAEWFLYQIVHNNVTNTRVAIRLYLAISIDTLHSKSVTLDLNAQKTSFNCLTVQECNFLTFEDNICKHF